MNKLILGDNLEIQKYITSINSRYKTGQSTEHTFRGDLQQLVETLLPGIKATNEPKRQQCGAPDFILTKKDVPVTYIETKDIGDGDLQGVKKQGNKEQFDRYKSALNSVIFTDYLDFYFYRGNQLLNKVAIGHVTVKGIKPFPENFATFTRMLTDFCQQTSISIRSPKQLARMMANKARMLADIIEQAIVKDSDDNEDSTLKDQMTAFREILIHDITPRGFADVYAQTIAYGMFAARLHDPSLDSFTRQEAAELIPRSNPFLRRLFGYIAGPDIDDRIKWVVDDLLDVFLACNVEEILKDYGKETQMEDPIIHFYETFLSEYDPKLRKARGVWYTPQPVVSFIVRAVDEILKTEFGLTQGLADNSKTKINVNVQGKMVEQEVHRVQILDPATGTGTFLAETIRHIHKQFDGQQGGWSDYVERHLIPRLNGFELLMASYAMAHLKLDLLLAETGFKPTKNQRLRVYLTNSLEESHPDTGTLFANWLSAEANEANTIKRDTPVMCVIGNPPYAISSSNKNSWIEDLLNDYKRNLKEKSYNSLSDDYVKFIRYGQYYIEKNGSGVLAYISNNSFIDGLIHRQMRMNLLHCFDKLYILDLHGDAKKMEICPDGSKDQNVFDIMQGVSINIFVKGGNRKKNEFGTVLHFDLQGNREFKYAFLQGNALPMVNWNRLETVSPYFYFVKKDFEGFPKYQKSIKIDELFVNYNNGIETGKDGFFYSTSYNELVIKIQLSFSDKTEAISRYNITNTDDYKFLEKFSTAKFSENYIRKVCYRPFDIVSCYYDIALQRRPAYNTMRNVFFNNLGLLTPRQVSGDFKHVFISQFPTDSNLTSTAKKFGSAPLFPLYIYPETTGQQTIAHSPERTPNLNLEIIDQIAEKLGLSFTPEKESTPNTFAPIDILDYIYAVLHSPSYREKYKEFLKIDFPRVPYPTDKNQFWKLVELGGEIRQLHLMESPLLDCLITHYPVEGDNVVGKVLYKDTRVYINDTQYFDGVPELAWNFYIGGYQPAQKWLKDRKGLTLNFDDIRHYQRIVVALVETERLMREVDAVLVL
ncbi:MAG TPA: N-6 DNA methylase [Bacteroidales bacterium]|nr:N-6 DNA methylase [Bacteroidales bacterium]HRZ48817.1 N-6 DNA methylase [Bacteroidales bacterium]